MKIVLTVHQFVPDYSSGTEILTFSVAKELLSRGHEVYVLTGFPARELCPDESRRDSYEIDGVKVFRFRHNHQPMGSQRVVAEIEFNNVLAAEFFAEILDEIRPDVIHFFHLSRLGTGLIDEATTRKIPAFYTPTDFWSICPTSQLVLTDGTVCSGPTAFAGNCVKHIATLTREGAIRNIAQMMPAVAFDCAAALAKKGLGNLHPIGREVSAVSSRRAFNVARLNSLAGIFAPTNLMSGVLSRNGVHPQNIRQLGYGLELANYENYRRERSGNATTFGFIGTLSPHKGCHILIDAFKRLKHPSLTLKIYGNPLDFPQYYAQLKQQADGDEAIKFCGTFPNSQIAEVIGGIDVLIVPSLWYENTPLVVYSAHAAGCPVVASDYPGMSEVVRDQKNGLLFPPGHIEQLAVCLSRLATEDDLLSKLGAGCSTPKSISQYVREIEAEYQIVLTQ